MKARSWVPAVAASLLLLSGCSTLPPGTASEVGDDRISTRQVDELTEAQCTLTAQGVEAGQAQVASLAQQKQQILRVLIDVSLNEQFAADQGVSAPADVRQQLVAQSQQGLEQVDPDIAAVIGPVVERIAASQADLGQIGAESTGQELSPDNLDQMIQQGLAQRQEWQQDVEVRTDARFGPDADGLPGAGDGSVSRAGSDFARQAQQAASGEDPAFAAGLPPAQRCGG